MKIYNFKNTNNMVTLHIIYYHIFATEDYVFELKNSSTNNLTR